MKFRIPEVLIGIFLTIAVLAIGATIPGIYPKYQGHQTETDNAAPKISTRDITDERIADYTEALAWFTLIMALASGALFWVTWRAGVRQSREMQASIAIAKQSADAATLQAKSASQAELPIVVVQNFEANPMKGEPINLPELPETIVILYSIINYGRTPAEFDSYCIETRFTKIPPIAPEYNRIHEITPGTMLLPNGPGLNQQEIISIKGKVREDLLAEKIHLWVYGFVRFKDYLGNPHETRFAAMALPYNPKPGVWLAFVYSSDTPAEYSKRN
jgi:hypothetical protein